MISSINKTTINAKPPPYPLTLGPPLDKVWSSVCHLSRIGLGFWRIRALALAVCLAHLLGFFPFMRTA